ncbi:MAG: metallophosphoesterase family protein [Cyanobacteria bacterium P01_H01_bin.121]
MAKLRNSRRIVIGDVHGQYVGLVTLLEQVAPGAGDTVYFLGDLIDRGPCSADVVQLVRREEYQVIRGNHEEMLLQSINTDGVINQTTLPLCVQSGGRQTLDSYQQQGSHGIDLLLDDIAWIQDLPYYLDLGNYWLVHAGLDPERSLDQQTADEYCWIRDAFHTSQQPYFKNKVIVTGHTITFTFPGIEPGVVVRGKGWLGIDTGAYHPKSGWLTAFVLDQELIYQVNVQTMETRALPLTEVTATLRLEQILQRRRHIEQLRQQQAAAAEAEAQAAEVAHS